MPGSLFTPTLLGPEDNFEVSYHPRPNTSKWRPSGLISLTSRGNQRQGGRLNVLKVKDDQNDQSQSVKEVPIKSSAICMSPVALPYAPILLNETFTKALWDADKPGLTHVLYHEIDTGDKKPVVSRPYRYDRVKQSTLDYHVEKMLKVRIIIPIQSPYITPVVLCRKNKGLLLDNPEAYRFAVDYKKLNAITNYPRYLLPLIDDMKTTIPHTTIMSTLDLRSGYFLLVVNSRDIVKTAFITKNGAYAFRRMPFGLSEAVPKFQKAIDIILKRVIGSRMVRYVLKLAEFNIEWPPGPGTQNEVANNLSRNLVENIDQFFREFAYSIRTAVNESTVKPPAELFLYRKLITPFQKLVMVSDGTEFAVGDIEKLFDEEEVQNESPDHPVRRGRNKEDQFDPDEIGRNNSTDPTPRSEEGQAAGIQEAEVVNNSISRSGKEERSAIDPSP
ncbi:retrovirus-related Pol polyprotein from transposon opus [Trichonephila clavipes]|nr:retrovirus-related Pol polyprotein from transposon opus [Trichonephila clavipes]